MKKIGFLSFGHWSASPYSQVRSGSDALVESIELAEAVEGLGADGAYFRVHHFAQQLASPFPLLAAIGARTKHIEIGTAVIDMRYENPLYIVEEVGAALGATGGAVTRQRRCDRDFLARRSDHGRCDRRVQRTGAPVERWRDVGCADAVRGRLRLEALSPSGTKTGVRRWAG